MTTKAKGISATQKLVTIAGRMDALYSDVLTIFLIERLVARLVSESQLRKLLVFKGGFVGFKVYESTRYTVDLDAIIRRASR